MRLSKKFVKALEALTQDPALKPDERLEAAGLLVRLYTASPLPNKERKAAAAPETKEVFESDTLREIAEKL